MAGLAGCREDPARALGIPLGPPLLLGWLLERHGNVAPREMTIPRYRRRERGTELGLPPAPHSASSAVPSPLLLLVPGADVYTNPAETHGSTGNPTPVW